MNEVARERVWRKMGEREDPKKSISCKLDRGRSSSKEEETER